MSQMHYTTLACGLLSDTDAELYACPNGKSVIVNNVVYVNTDAGDVTMNLIRRKSGSAVDSYLFPLNLLLHTQESAEMDENQMLQQGDSIRGSANTVGVVSWIINGIIKDVP